VVSWQFVKGEILLNSPRQIQQEIHPKVVVIISANAEWRAVRECFPDQDCQPSPSGEWFHVDLTPPPDPQPSTPPIPAVFLHGGWGKIAAAASTQYAIDRWRPSLLINLGTCGGFDGLIERGEIILAEKTLVYDIHEQMGDPDEAIDHYTTQIDLSWLPEPYPIEARRTLLVSADRDLSPADIPGLRDRYAAIAGDWESGAIAYVAARNNIPILILRGVTDLVADAGGEAYGNIDLFVQATRDVMRRLVETLPAWLPAARL
jgi:adenosylhomocysteine nucleosidase